jgi:hypothetical protein
MRARRVTCPICNERTAKQVLVHDPRRFGFASAHLVSVYRCRCGVEFTREEIAEALPAEDEAESDDTADLRLSAG